MIRLAFVAVACCLALLRPVWAEDGGSWTGKRVMTKKGGIKIGYTDENDQTKYVATLDNMIYRVEQEKGKFIKVRHRGVSGWFSKNDAVLLKDAISYFTARIRENEKDAYAYAHRGSAWSERGELDIALKDYNEAIRLEPEEASWFNNRGLIWHDKKEYDKALADYDEAIRLDPKYARPFLNGGVTRYVKKEYEKALADYDEAIRLDPKYGFAFKIPENHLYRCKFPFIVAGSHPGRINGRMAGGPASASRFGIPQSAGSMPNSYHS
jgi:tetratricopeptide (TPR) repeat protein